jgi:hypothetical protein
VVALDPPGALCPGGVGVGALVLLLVVVQAGPGRLAGPPRPGQRRPGRRGAAEQPGQPTPPGVPLGPVGRGWPVTVVGPAGPLDAGPGALGPPMLGSAGWLLGGEAVLGAPAGPFGLVAGDLGMPGAQLLDPGAGLPGVVALPGPLLAQLPQLLAVDPPAQRLTAQGPGAPVDRTDVLAGAGPAALGPAQPFGDPGQLPGPLPRRPHRASRPVLLVGLPGDAVLSPAPRHPPTGGPPGRGCLGAGPAHPPLPTTNMLRWPGVAPRGDGAVRRVGGVPAGPRTLWLLAVRELVARERTTGIRLHARDVAAAAGISERRAYELLRVVRAEDQS